MQKRRNFFFFRKQSFKPSMQIYTHNFKIIIKKESYFRTREHIQHDLLNFLFLLLFEVQRNNGVINTDHYSFFDGLYVMYGDKLIQCFTNHKRGRGMLTDNENRPLPQIYGTNKVLRVRIGTATLIQPSHNRCPILLTDEMVITLASSRNVSCDASFRIWRINAQYMYLLFLRAVLELTF